MMDTIKPYREKLVQAKRQLDEAWKGECGVQPIVTGTETSDVLELKESLSRVSNIRELYTTTTTATAMAMAMRTSKKQQA